jgi:hypothetical protein
VSGEDGGNHSLAARVLIDSRYTIKVGDKDTRGFTLAPQNLLLPSKLVDE